MDNEEKENIVILGGGAGAKEPSPQPAEDDDADMGAEEYQAACDVKAALKSGDDEAFALALKKFVSLAEL